MLGNVNYSDYTDQQLLGVNVRIREGWKEEVTSCHKKTLRGYGYVQRK